MVLEKIMESMFKLTRSIANFLPANFLFPLFMKMFFFHDFPETTHDILSNLFEFLLELSLSDEEKRIIFFKELSNTVRSCDKLQIMRIVEDLEIIGFVNLLECFQQFLKISKNEYSPITAEIDQNLIIFLLRCDNHITDQVFLKEFFTIFVVILEKKNAFSECAANSEFLENFFDLSFKEKSIDYFLYFINMFWQYYNIDEDTIERKKIFYHIGKYLSELCKKIDDVNDFHENLLSFFCIFYQIFIINMTKNNLNFQKIYVDSDDFLSFDLLFSENVKYFFIFLFNNIFRKIRIILHIFWQTIILIIY